MIASLTPVRIGRLVAFVVGIMLVGSLIGIVSSPKVPYANFAKPFFAPPAWLFGPVWSVLYVMIGVVGWRLYENVADSANMKLWWTQLALNFGWAPVFFMAGSRTMALVVILALLAIIVALIVRLWHSDRASSLLLVPYCLWVSFATALNAEIVRLN